MASTDWSMLSDALSSGDCARGVTSGTTKPTGGGTFVYAINSLTNTVGVVALYTAQGGFAPMDKGCDIRGAMVRATSGGPTLFSPFLFAGLGTIDSAGVAYMLGLADGDPSRIALRKGALSGGIPDEAPGGVNKILRRSNDTIAIDTWVHLRLEVVVNTNNDVILNCYRNTGNVSTPSWAAIPGMDPYTDDALGINSGSAPLTSGRAGFGGRVADVSRRMFFDHLEIARQL